VPKKKNSVIWLYSEDSFTALPVDSNSNHEIVHQQISEFLRAQTKKKQPAVYIEVYWHLPSLRRGLKHGARAELFYNRYPPSPALQSKIQAALAWVGLNENGRPLRPLPKDVPVRRAPSKKARPQLTPGSLPSVDSVLDSVRSRRAGKPCDQKFTTHQSNQLYLSTGTIEQFSEREVLRYLAQFGRCDWGDVPLRITRSNNRATLTQRGYIKASYPASKGRLLLIQYSYPQAIILCTVKGEPAP
jgi:hypothetical protein